MQIGQRTAGEVAIIEITGDITLSKGGDVIIKDKVQSLLQQGRVRGLNREHQRELEEHVRRILRHRPTSTRPTGSTPTLRKLPVRSPRKAPVQGSSQ